MSASTPIDRDALFVLVWERQPAEAADALGLSIKGLDAVCNSLKVPPPDQFWTDSLQSDPPGDALIETIYNTLRPAVANKAAVRAGSSIHLSPRQREYLDEVLAEFAERGVDISACVFDKSGIQVMSPALAAQLLCRLPHRMKRPRDDQSNDPQVRATYRVLSQLIEKLLPIARVQTVILPLDETRLGKKPQRSLLIVRVGAGLLQRLAELYRLVTRYQLQTVSINPRDPIAGFPVILQSWGAMEILRDATLHINRTHLWCTAEIDSRWHRRSCRTEMIPLASVGPIPQLSGPPVEVSDDRVRPVLTHFSDRLTALQRSEAGVDIVRAALNRVESGVPNAQLALIDRLISRETDEQPLLGAHRAVSQADELLAQWEDDIERERNALAFAMLGVAPGDDIVSVQQGEPVRLRIQQAWLSADETTLYLTVSGARYRKDGSPGKRQDTLYFTLSRIEG